MAYASTLRRELLTLIASLSDAIQDSAAAALAFRRQAITGYFGPRYPRAQVGRMLSQLRSRGAIRIEHDVVTLTPEGRTRVRQYQLDALGLTKPPTWDGRWRIVIWDIAERDRTKRDQVRHLLKNLKFVRIQRSIWVTPYPCRDEVGYLREQLGIGRGLIYLEATVIEGAAQLRRHFHLTIPNTAAKNEPNQ